MIRLLLPIIAYIIIGMMLALVHTYQQGSRQSDDVIIKEFFLMLGFWPIEIWIVIFKSLKRGLSSLSKLKDKNIERARERARRSKFDLQARD